MGLALMMYEPRCLSRTSAGVLGIMVLARCARQGGALKMYRDRV